MCARAVVAAGLHPSIGVHHANRGNPFALADDVIEPFRPLVDLMTLLLLARGVDGVTPAAKQAFATLTALDLPGDAGVTPVASAAVRVAQTLATAFQTGRATDLWLPSPPGPLDLARIDTLIDVG